MTLQAVDAHTAFSTALRVIVQVLQKELQEANTPAMCVEQLNDICQFEQQNKLFTDFLTANSKYKLRRRDFRYRTSRSRSPSSDTSMDGSMMLHLGISNSSPRADSWRGASTLTAPSSVNVEGPGSLSVSEPFHGDFGENEYFLFNDTGKNLFFADYASECAENALPSLPPSVANGSVLPLSECKQPPLTINLSLVEDGNESIESVLVPSVEVQSAVHPVVDSDGPSALNESDQDRELVDCKDPEYEVHDDSKCELYGDNADEEEKCDSEELIHLPSFTGTFTAEQTMHVEFKKDEIVKPMHSEEQKTSHFTARPKAPKAHSFLDEHAADDVSATPSPQNNVSIASVSAPLYPDAAPIPEPAPIPEAPTDRKGTCDFQGPDGAIASTFAFESDRNGVDDGSGGDIGDDESADIGDVSDDEKAEDERCEDSGLLSTFFEIDNDDAAMVSFIQYSPPEPAAYSNIEEHPHYHPVIHGQECPEGKVAEETAVDGEETPDESSGAHRVDVAESHFEDVFNSNPRHSGDRCGPLRTEIAALRQTLDDHMRQNHEDMNAVNEALHSIQDGLDNRYHRGQDNGE